jgi:hypothetical protein
MTLLHVILISSDDAFNAGKMIAITGKGLSESTIITICGKECIIQSSDYDHLKCLTPSHITIEAVKLLDDMNITKDLIETINIGNVFSSAAVSSLEDNVDDLDYKTYYYDYDKDCYVGVATPSGMRVKPFRMRFYPRLQYSSYFGISVFEGSNDGGSTYVELGKQLQGALSIASA